MSLCSRTVILPATRLGLAIAAAPTTAQAAPGLGAVTALAVFATPISDKYTALGGANSFLGAASVRG